MRFHDYMVKSKKVQRPGSRGGHWHIGPEGDVEYDRLQGLTESVREATLKDFGTCKGKCYAATTALSQALARHNISHVQKKGNYHYAGAVHNHMWVETASGHRLDPTREQFEPGAPSVTSAHEGHPYEALKEYEADPFDEKTVRMALKRHMARAAIES